MTPGRILQIQNNIPGGTGSVRSRASGRDLASTTILRLKRELADGQIKSAGNNQVAVKLLLGDGSSYDPPGTLQFSEVTVDQGTGAVTLRAIFPNDAGLLLRRRSSWNVRCRTTPW